MIEFSPPDSFFVENIKRGVDVDAAINALTEKHMGIISKNANHYSQATGVCPADLLRDAPLIVYKAAENYNLDKGSSFSTFLFNSSRFHFLNISKVSKKFYNQYSTDPAELAILESPACDEDRISAKKKELLDYIIFLAENSMDERIEFIIKSRYFGDKKEKSYKHIAKFLQMTGQGVKNMHDQFIKMCKYKLKATDMLDFI